MIIDNSTVDISLVILTFNRREALRRCLNSITAMNRGELSVEVIVVDDGSEIDNLPVVNQFNELLDVAYFKKNNEGVASTRNFGLRKARGQFIGFIADDYTLPEDYLINVAEFYKNHPEAWVITHNIRPTGPSVFRYVQRLYYQMTLLQRFDSRDFNKELAKSVDLPPSRGAVFRKEIFGIVGEFNEDCLTGEDGEFGMRMASYDMPVFFFMNKYIDHWEDKGLIGYLKQRINYGRGFFRVLQSDNAGVADKHSMMAVLSSTIKRYGRWLRLSYNLHRCTEYILLSPFIVLFLFFFYVAFYLESTKISAPAVPKESQTES